VWWVAGKEREEGVVVSVVRLVRGGGEEENGRETKTKWSEWRFLNEV
jgi:hypothetical protein